MTALLVPPRTQYAEHEGALIAYQVFGTGSGDLLISTGFASNIDHIWDFPHVAERLQRLAGFARLILFDRRGTGHSDPLPPDSFPTWENWADDVRVVLDAAGSTRTALYGERDGGIMALLFAAAHPERTAALILANTTARYLAAEDYPAGYSPAAAEQNLRFLSDKWGTEEFAAMMMPSLESDPRLLHLVARYQRGAATPRVAAAHFRYVFNFDARAVLSSIAAPTLVLHRTTYPILGIEHGRYLAQHIPNARLIEVPGREATFILSREADMPFDSILEFLTGMPVDGDSDRALATVLFCDIVGSTERAAELGDVAWRRLLDRYSALVRNEVTRFGGREVDTAGDGFFAAFDRPTRAIRCAVIIRDTVRELDLQVRCGLHTAECIFTGARLSGIAVHIGARVAAAAAPCEVWLTDTVKNLVAGSGIRFSARGTHALKGVPGEWPLYAAT